MTLFLTLICLIAVLLFEQVRPLPASMVVGPLRKLTLSVSKLAGGGRHREQLAWMLLVLGGMLLCVLIVASLSGWLGFLFSMVVLYFTLGFRHESHYFTDIHLALRSGETGCACALLSEWSGVAHEESDPDAIARRTIERAVVGAHRNVFGVLFWFVILGPGGAVMYRLARFLYEEWNPPSEAPSQWHGVFAAHAFTVIDWLPSRMTAILFAIGGNFEDAVFCWRAQAVLWPDRTGAVLVTSGAGALGVRLGEPDSSDTGGGLTVGVGEAARVDDLQATVGLVWRALIVCLTLLALTVVAVLAGS